MTTKEYLSQAFDVARLIRAKESRIQDLRDKQIRIAQAIPVTVTAITPRQNIAITWDLGDGITQDYEVSDVRDLFITKAEAERETLRKSSKTREEYPV